MTEVTQFPFEVHAPAAGREGTFTATLRIPVQPGEAGRPGNENQILHYIRSIQLKNDFMNGWCKDNAPNYGLEIRGGPRPVFKVAEDRTSGVVAYEQDFRLTRPI